MQHHYCLHLFHIYLHEHIISGVLLSCAPRSCAHRNEFSRIQSRDHPIAIKVAGRTCACRLISEAEQDVHIILVHIIVSIEVARYGNGPDREIITEAYESLRQVREHITHGVAPQIDPEIVISASFHVRDQNDIKTDIRQVGLERLDKNRALEKIYAVHVIPATDVVASVVHCGIPIHIDHIADLENVAGTRPRDIHGAGRDIHPERCIVSGRQALRIYGDDVELPQA